MNRSFAVDSHGITVSSRSDTFGRVIVMSRLVFVCVCLLAIEFLFHTPALAQRIPVRSKVYVSRFGSRYDAVRLLCGDEQILNLKLGSLEEFEKSTKPADWLIVSLGESEHLSTILENPNRFLSEGGSLLVADDHDSNVFAWAGILIRTGVVSVSQETDAYEGLPTCPIINRLERGSPLFSGVTRLVLNNAGFLEGPGVQQFARAWLPRRSYIAGEQPLPVGEAPIVASGEIIKGRFVLVGDHSLFANEMIQEGDNLLATFNILKWLTANKNAETLRVLFLQEGQPIDSWVDPQFEEGDWPLPLNEILLDLEKGNVFNKLLSAAQQSIPQGPLRRVALLLVTLLFAILLCRRLMRSRNEDVELASIPDAQTVAELDDSLFARRNRELLASKSFLEPARQMCRQLFLDTLGPLDWKSDAIHVSQDADLWTRWRTRSTVNRLWKIADGSLAHRISHSRFLRIAGEIDLLRQELAAQTLRFHKQVSPSAK